MPRYTDIDNLIAEYDRVHVGPAGGARKLMVDAPTADVAPKSEVAREIVEFLFRRSKSLQHVFKDNPDSAQCFRGRFELENAAVIIANEYGVELKKKYGVTDTNVGDKFFTAEQVRTMSREEVSKNYSAIMKSMKKWG